MYKVNEVFWSEIMLQLESVNLNIIGNQPCVFYTFLNVLKK
jgi:hypothetical protein